MPAHLVASALAEYKAGGFDFAQQGLTDALLSGTTWPGSCCLGISRSRSASQGSDLKGPGHGCPANPDGDLRSRCRLVRRRPGTRSRL
jgi:hypothetical protein